MAVNKTKIYNRGDQLFATIFQVNPKGLQYTRLLVFLIWIWHLLSCFGLWLLLMIVAVCFKLIVAESSEGNGTAVGADVNILMQVSFSQAVTKSGARKF